MIPAVCTYYDRTPKVLPVLAVCQYSEHLQRFVFSPPNVSQLQIAPPVICTY